MKTMLMNTTTDSSIPRTYTPSEHTEECQPTKKKQKGLGASLPKAFSNNSERHSHSSPHPLEKVEAEITRYFGLPVVDDMDSDPMQWRKHEANRLTVLSVLAKKYICKCGTSVFSERIFSKSG